MKSNAHGWTWFVLIVAGSLSLGLLLDAGHFLWPVVLIAAGAYIVPTLLMKICNTLSARRSGSTKDPKTEETLTLFNRRQ
jgi:hypothetical protein